MSRRSSKAQVNKVKAPSQLPSFDRLCSVAPPVHCALLLPSVSVHSMVLALHIYEYTYAIFFCFSFCSVGWLIQPRFTLYGFLNTISCTMDHTCRNYTCCLKPLLISTGSDVVHCTGCTIVDLKCDLVYSIL